jgi:peptide/nickel transport system permease protein
LERSQDSNSLNMNYRRRTLVLILLLAALHLPILVPGFVAPYDYAQQNRELPFAPPNRLHFIDEGGTFHFRPFAYAWQQRADGSGDSYEEDRTHTYPLHLFVQGSPYSILGPWTVRLHLFGVQAPGQLFLVGTDDFGRDQFSRILYGGRISLFAGLLGTSLALFVGVLLGLISGYYGKWMDAVIMRFAELFLALPWLYLLFAVRAVLPLRIKTTEAFLLLVGVVGFVGWAKPARLVRGIVLSAKERTFALAAKAMGASDAHILRRHILPQTYGIILTTAALLVPQFILAEVTLSFLGLGVGEPMPSLGNLLGELQKYRVLTSYWWMYAPAVVLIVLFLAYQWASAMLQEKFAEVQM